MRKGQITHYTCPTCGDTVYVADDGTVYCGSEPDCEFSRLSPQLIWFVNHLVTAEATAVQTYPDKESDDFLDFRDELILDALGLDSVKCSNFDLSEQGNSECHNGG